MFLPGGHGSQYGVAAGSRNLSYLAFHAHFDPAISGRNACAKTLNVSRACMHNCLTVLGRRRHSIKHKNCRYDCDKESFGSHATAFLVGLCFNPPNAVICEEFLIIGAVYGDGRIVGRSVLDLLTFNIKLNLPIRPIDFSH